MAFLSLSTNVAPELSNVRKKYKFSRARSPILHTTNCTGHIEWSISSRYTFALTSSGGASRLLVF